MKNLKLLICILTTILLASTIFAVLPALSQQPPLDTTTMHVGTIGQPKNVDPSQAYDSASGELIQNVYDSMLEFGSQGTNVTNKPVAPIPANDSVNIGTNVAVLGSTTDIPGVCQLPTITLYANGSSVWTFQVNTNLIFQSWTLPNGNIVSGEQMNWTDIVYYFQRMFVQDSHNSPEWMIMGPAFGVANWDANQTGAGPGMNAANETYVANLIQSFISGFSNATGQYVQMYFQHPAIGMYDILDQTWSSIPPMQWSIDHGCWNGLWTTGWSAAYRRFPSDLFTPLDEHTSKSLYSSSTAEPAMCGTGPYSFTYWNQATDQWRIDAFEQCVSHPWPGPYGSSDPAPTTVIDTGINTWATSKMMFLGGDLDINCVPEANMYDLLQSPSNAELPIPGITLYYNIPTLETDAIFFNFNITAGSYWMPIVNGVADPTFFSNLNVRRAFCQALNMSAYISGAYYGEALHPSSFWCTGLTPTAGYDSTLTPWDINEDYVYGNLTAVGITSFTMTFWYGIGNTQTQIAAQDMANVFADINAKYGTHYDITVEFVWLPFNFHWDVSMLPFFWDGWQADFSDADDFVVPFMASWGTFAMQQGYSNSTIDSQIAAEEALGNTPAAPARCAILQELQYEYYQQAISLPTVQPTSRHWSRDWVYGYYVNQLYPGLYYQDLYKKPPTTVLNIQISSTLTPIITYSTIYIYQGGMRQGGGSSQPIIPMEYFINVSRDDDNTNVPLLLVAIGLYRTPGELGLAKAYVNVTYVLVPPLGSANATLEWYEDGVTETITGNSTGITYTVGVDTYPIGDYNQTGNNNKVTNCTFVAKTLAGDINGDGTVDIYDAILLAAAFGSTPGSSNWNPSADLNGDGIVDIYDAIILAANFNNLVLTQ
jgi:peptide/nickel transport system substrate-binding protein